MTVSKYFDLSKKTAAPHGFERYYSEYWFYYSYFLNENSLLNPYPKLSEFQFFFLVEQTGKAPPLNKFNSFVIFHIFIKANIVNFPYLFNAVEVKMIKFQVTRILIYQRKSRAARTIDIKWLQQFFNKEGLPEPQITI